MPTRLNTDKVFAIILVAAFFVWLTLCATFAVIESFSLPPLGTTAESLAYRFGTLTAHGCMYATLIAFLPLALTLVWGVWFTRRRRR